MTVEIHGFCEAPFQPLKDAFAANFDECLEVGASLALTHKGKTVVDLWAGWADPARSRPWDKDTVVALSSTTKLSVIIPVLMLADRGLIELDAPISRYWPEFAQGGKGEVTVRDALTHQAGVPGLDPPVTSEVMADWDAFAARLAAEPHWFGGERRVMYHAGTYGTLLGELIHRVDGRRPARYFREEIKARCGADFNVGLERRSDMARVATVQLLAPPPPSTNEIVLRMGRSFPPADTSTWDYMSAERPGTIGYSNGRAIARLCAIMAMGGELDGVRYMSRAMVQEASQEQAFGDCPYLGRLRLGLGFGLYSSFFAAVSPDAFHWGGFGGSWGLMDAKAQISLGYAPNNWIADVESVGPRHRAFSDALERILPTLGTETDEP